ncbi:MAG: hypothetical protein WBI14_06725 [Anaerolineaceae bacterium]
MKNNLEQKIDAIASQFSWNREQLAPRYAFITKLETRLSNELSQAKPDPLRKRPRVTVWQFALAVGMLLVVVVFAVGPTEVLARIRTLLGFVDGFGTVSSEDSLRTLSAPASLTKDDVTVTVYDALLTSEKTTLHYSITGLSNSDYVLFPDQEECTEPEKIRLPDGTMQSIQSPVPDSVNSFELVLACIPGTIVGQVPEDWTIPIKINTNLGSKTVYPLEDKTPQAVAPGVPNSTQPVADIFIEVGRVVKTDDGFILIGTEVTRRPAGWAVLRTNLTITDANSQPVEFTYPEGATAGSDFSYGVDRYPWAVQFKADGVTFPIKISTESKAFEPMSGDERAELKVDVGQNPQNGDVIEVNQSVAFAGDGNTVKLNKVTVYKDGYGFNLTLGGLISNLNVSLKNCKGVGSGGTGFAAIEPETMSQSIFCESVPKGEITIFLTDAFISHERQIKYMFWSPD